MNYDSISVKAISVEFFQPYGQIVQQPLTQPTAEGETFSFWSDIARYHIQGNTEIGLCTVTSPPDNRVSDFERHLKTPEILIPADTPFILPLLSNDGQVEAFRVNIGEAVVIHAGVWHGPCIPAEKSDATYYVIFRQHTPAEDVEKISIDDVLIQA